MKTLVVTGTDTDVGKTWISCLLLRQLLARGCRCGAYKPVCSGAVTGPDGSLQWNDVALLHEACGRSLPEDLICPQKFEAAVAPGVAARLQQTEVDDGLLRAGVERWRPHCDLLVLEGAGGLLCPLSDHSVVADLAMDLQAPLLIVAANRLGVINHTLMTVEVARARGLQVAAVVLNRLAPEHSEPDLSCRSNREELRRWLPSVPLFTCDFQGTQLNAVGHQTEADFWSDLLPQGGPNHPEPARSAVRP